MRPTTSRVWVSGKAAGDARNKYDTETLYRVYTLCILNPTYLQHWVYLISRIHYTVVDTCTNPLYHGPIALKTPNTKCRLYWCLIEFIDWRSSQSCWHFWPLLWTRATPPSLQFTSPPLLPVWLPTVYTVCNRGGGGIGLCGSTGVIKCVFGQIPNLQYCFTMPNKNLGGKGSSDR